MFLLFAIALVVVEVDAAATVCDVVVDGVFIVARAVAIADVALVAIYIGPRFYLVS